MKVFVCLLALIACASASAIYGAPAIAAPALLNTGSSTQSRSQDAAGNYAFAYNEQHATGGSSRSESGNPLGAVGSYSLNVGDGRQRVVKYVADGLGFRAAIATNEPGTAPKAPASVAISSPAAVVAAPVAVAAPAIAAPVAVAAPSYAAPAYAAPVVAKTLAAGPVAIPSYAAPAYAAPAYAASAYAAPAYAVAPALSAYSSSINHAAPAYAAKAIAGPAYAAPAYAPAKYL